MKAKAKNAKTAQGDHFKVAERDIAKWFCSRIPIEYSHTSKTNEFAAQIEGVHAAIKRLTKPQREALKCAFVFANKVPYQERADLFQDLFLALHISGYPDAKLSYAIARCDWIDYWKSLSTKSQFSFESIEARDLSEHDDMRWQSEMLVSEIEHEHKHNERASALLKLIPSTIKAIAHKRMMGQPLTTRERVALHRFVKANPNMITS